MNTTKTHRILLSRTIVGALVAGTASAGLAGTAQAAPSPGSSHADVASPTAAAATPRYVVQLIRFKCVDESGFDRFGSDEPYWVTTAKQGSISVKTSTSEVFGNVDSGDTRRFSVKDRRNTVWPERGSTRGGVGAVSFSVQLWEDDIGGSVTEVVNKTVKVLDVVNEAGQPIGVAQWGPKVPPIVRRVLYNLFADDMMGSQTFSYGKALLARELKTVGSSWVPPKSPVRFSGRSGDIPFTDVAGGPDYDLTFRITRVA